MRTTTRRTAALALVTAGAGAALLLAGPAHADAPALPAVPQVLPLDTTDGLPGVPRGSVPAVGTPDLSGIPGVEQLPGFAATPLPARTAAETPAGTPAATTAPTTAATPAPTPTSVEGDAPR